MKMLKKLLCLIPVFLTFAVLGGCGGHSAAPPADAANPGGPPPPGAGSTPSNAKVIPDIQKLGGWQNCTASCTGTPAAVFSMAQGIASPSQSGASARFQLLAGTRPFGGALWFKFLGAANSATHFVYDLSFFMDNPSAPQALEFNVSQSAGGSHYDFSTQCDLAGGRVWRVWDPVAKQWAASAVPCVQPPPSTWNHLTWEFERDSAGHVIFTAVTLNGNRGAVNMTMPHTPDSQSGIDVAFQADANNVATPYSVWVDKISLTYW